MLEYLRQKLEFAYFLELKDFGGRLIHENHPTYLVVISIIKVQCEKIIKSQKFFKKVI